MTAKAFFKTIFALLTGVTLVIVGMNNRDTIRFALPPVIHPIKQPAALMYAAFFACGILAGSVLASGGAKKGAALSPSKESKPAKK